jgi:NTE family protein
MIRTFFFVITLVGISLNTSAQSRPKIGLVLSGGGAKGIAHIRVLQALDSLGIVPDFIAGTSMGSVVGGLYAAGYTGNEIDSIAKTLDWQQLMSNSVSLDEINIEEKDEFGRYIYELPMSSFKPKLPLGLIEGQHIEELLSRLFFHVNGISNFQQLPTPFLCVASDIVKGEPVVLDRGSLSQAIRASMSIPSVFAPVRIDNRLLVDGGVFNNMPVSYCRQMGATFIIASDVDGGLYKESELVSAAQLLMQTALLAGNITYRKELQDVDLHIDVFPHLRYGTMDFEQRADMMRAGREAVNEIIPELVKIAASQKEFPIRQVRKLSRENTRYRIREIATEGIGEPNNKLVRARFEAQPEELLGPSQIGSRVHRLMGTRLFDKINYRIEGDSVTSTLTLQAAERPASAVKFAMHYDTERGAGVILNFTQRNLLLPASRLVTTLDLAESPRLRANYFYYFGKRMRWWHFSEVYGERLLINSFIEGTPVADVFSNHLGGTTMLNYSVNRNRYWGVGIIAQRSRLRAKVDPATESNPDPLEISDYRFSTVGARLHVVHNTLNKVFFPTRGRWLRAELNWNLNPEFKADLLVTLPDTSFNFVLEGNLPTYFRLNLKALQVVPLSRRLSLQIWQQAGLMQETFSSYDDLSAYRLAAGDFNSVGGWLYRSRSSDHLFLGLREGELSVPQLLAVGANLQYTLAKNVYITPGINVLAAGYGSSEFWNGLGDFDFREAELAGAFYQVGYGAMASYFSLLGPIQIGVSHNAQTKQLRAFFNLGFVF